MSDRQLMPNIWAVLALLPSDPDLICIEIEEGIVYIEGLVSSLARRRAFERALYALIGVRRVINCLAVEHVARLPHTPPAGPGLSPKPALRAVSTLPR